MDIIQAFEAVRKNKGKCVKRTKTIFYYVNSCGNVCSFIKKRGGGFLRGSFGFNFQDLMSNEWEMVDIPESIKEEIVTLHFSNPQQTTQQ